MQMMSCGSAAHSRIQRNVLVALDNALRDSGCSPHGSDMGVRTSDIALRYPDVSAFCGKGALPDVNIRAFDDPKLVVEVLSPTTRDKDISVKLPEYREIGALNHILYIDPEPESVRLLTRTGPRSWHDETIEPHADVELVQLGITLYWRDIFAHR
jgi:Uma2 family endonuclease